MKSLVRKQFLDLTWNASDLDAVAEFWLRLYGCGYTWRVVSRVAQHSVEIRLSGFPQHTSESFREELEHRIATTERPDLVVSLADPETLVLRSEPRTGLPSLAGLGVPLLVGDVFDGLLIELRFCVTGGEGLALLAGAASISLVLVGEISGGQLLLKSLWRSPFPEAEDKGFWLCGMEEERAFIAGFVRFRTTGELDTPLAKVMFCGFETLRWRDGPFPNLLEVPFDRPRFPGLFVRFVIIVGLLTLVGFLIADGLANDDDVKFKLGVFGALFVGLVAGKFAYNECLLLFGTYRFYREYYSVDPEEAVGHKVLTAEETPLRNDLRVRQYTDELAKAGFTHIGDVARFRDGDVGWVYRVFSAPDRTTYFTLICALAFGAKPGERQHVWPAIVRFHARTFFQSGGRIDSVNESAYEYIRQPIGPHILFRVLTTVPDPIEFYRSHCEAAEAFGLENGLAPTPHVRFEEYIRQQQAISAEGRQYALDHPYSWRDHLRWYLQWPRKEQRG